MRTNIVLDPDLIEQAMKASGSATMREAVHVALQELVARHHARRLKSLRGRALVADDYDVRQVRRRMAHGPG